MFFKRGRGGILRDLEGYLIPPNPSFLIPPNWRDLEGEWSGGD